MKDLSEQAQVIDAPETWRARHEQPQGWAVRQDGTSAKVVYEQLCGLDTGASAEDVAALTGDKTLVERKRCTECGVRSWSCVLLGDCVSCAACLHRAMGVVMGLVRP